VDVVCGLDDLSTLCSAISFAGLGDALTEGTWTLFAPNNQAFDDLGYDVLDSIMGDENFLTDILLFHAIDDVVASTDLICSGLSDMANGGQSRTVCSSNNGEVFQKGGGNPGDNMPSIKRRDIQTCQGFIHVVGKSVFVLCRRLLSQSLSQKMQPSDHISVSHVSPCLVENFQMK
jgi:uncharacterized surface protein with fasciclin (FAS1) repeats